MKNIRIIAISLGGLGDTILFSPVLKALTTFDPSAQIELLVANRLAREVYSSVEKISRITFIHFNKPSLLLKTLSLVLYLIKCRIRGGFDVGLLATGLNPRFGTLLKHLAGVRNIFYAPEYPAFATDFECNLNFARRFDHNISRKDIFVPLTKNSEMEAKRISEQNNLRWSEEEIIAIYPSTELIHRPRWNLLKLLRVLRQIKVEGFRGKFVVVGSADEGRVWAILDKDKIADANLAGKLSILGSASFISQCTLTIGNDGGLMHVAGAVGCPLVVIMTNTPLSYRPPGENTIVIHSQYSCCDGLYPKRPNECTTAKCVEDITVDEVYKACLEYLP